FQRDTVGDDQAIRARELREHRADGAAVHLAIHLLREVAGLGRESSAAAYPDRAAARAGARLAGALLGPRLLATAAHFGASLLGLGARTSGRTVGGHDLVHQRLVELLAEGGFRHLQLATAN